MRNPLEDYEGKVQFAGHETFPLRQLWLKKAYDGVQGGVAVTRFTDPDAISVFGVGRNMAVSIRYWSIAAGVIREVSKKLIPTEFGDAVFGEKGHDPYVEHAATPWLVHWKLASEPSAATTTFFAFNGLATPEFDADQLFHELSSVVTRRGWRAKPITLKRDVEVFLRGYLRREAADIEDAAEPLLAELGLLRDMRSNGWYEFVRGPKPTLPDAVFAIALRDFWERHHSHSASLSLEQIAYGVGSPGRVFKLDEDTVASTLIRCQELTSGAWVWTDTAGLRQAQRRAEVDSDRLLAKAYKSPKAKTSANS